MADTPHIPSPSPYASLDELRKELLHDFLAGEGNERLLEERIAAIEEAMLHTPAPTLNDAITKLQLLWAGSLHGNDDDSIVKMQIIEELSQGAELLQAQIPVYDILKLKRDRGGKKSKND